MKELQQVWTGIYEGGTAGIYEGGTAGMEETTAGMEGLGLDMERLLNNTFYTTIKLSSWC